MRRGRVSVLPAPANLRDRQNGWQPTTVAAQVCSFETRVLKERGRGNKSQTWERTSARVPAVPHPLCSILISGPWSLFLSFWLEPIGPHATHRRQVIHPQPSSSGRPLSHGICFHRIGPCRYVTRAPPIKAGRRPPFSCHFVSLLPREHISLSLPRSTVCCSLTDFHIHHHHVCHSSQRFLG
jgi:hypothetical protein